MCKKVYKCRLFFRNKRQSNPAQSSCHQLYWIAKFLLLLNAVCSFSIVAYPCFLSQIAKTAFNTPSNTNNRLFFIYISPSKCLHYFHPKRLYQRSSSFYILIDSYPRNRGRINSLNTPGSIYSSIDTDRQDKLLY